MKAKDPVRICVPVCERSLEALKESASLAALEGELVELRLDCLSSDELRAAEKGLDSWLPTIASPVILTLRPLGQGGLRRLDQGFRFEFLNQRKGAAFLDIELELGLWAEKHGGLDWSRIICSHHDFAAVPSDLEEIYGRMAATRAEILKISVHPEDATDCIAVFRLLERAQKDGRKMIAIAMGPAGVLTRILGPSRGSYLTYAPREDKGATASGQIRAEVLKEMYRLEKIDLTTQITGVIGKPVGHSISPAIHNAALDAAGINGVYIPFEVGDIRAFIKRLVNPATRELSWNLRGLSVTAPHKSAVMELVEPDVDSREIGAVNTIVIDEDNLKGYNTDGPALVQPLIQRMGSLKGLRCAVIGAGGAARAALWGLGREGASTTVFARDITRAKPLAEIMRADCKPLRQHSFAEFDIVINATPLGTRGTLVEETIAMASQLQGARLAYDLVYNPSETRFLREAREAGCETLGGLQMLIAQAALQFKLWNGQNPALDAMTGAATEALD